MQRFIIGGLVFLGLLIVGLPRSGLPTADAVPAGLIASWSGDSNANDISGNSNHATLHNGAQAGVPGLFSGAFHFDGVDDLALTSLLLPSQGTLGLWVNPASLDTIDGLIGTLGTANGNDRLWLTARGPLGGLGVGPDRLVVNTGSCCDNEIIVSSPLVVGTWTHLALTFDYLNDAYSVYVNGHAVGMSTAPRTAPTQTLTFGGLFSDFGQSFFFEGLLDDVKLFDRVLDAAEIAEMQDLAEPIPEPSTMLLLGTGLLGFVGHGWRRRTQVRTAESRDEVRPAN